MIIKYIKQIEIDFNLLFLFYEIVKKTLVMLKKN
jgi:hypothetical protein